MTKKLIVIEGTDCSGKKTQSELLAKRLTDEGEKSYYFAYPNYDSPTGKIIGLAYLGKSYLAEELINGHRKEVLDRLGNIYKDGFDIELVNKAIDLVAEEMGVGWFPEGADKVDPHIGGGYYAIDRAYNASRVEELLKTGNVIMDRYVYSNMGHQGGKMSTPEERKEYYEWNLYLEHNMYGLRKDDIRIFLHVPTIYTTLTKNGRSEALDEHEKNEEHLKNAESAYMELVELYNFETIDCLKKKSNPIHLSDIKSIEEIHEEVYNRVTRSLRLR